MPSINGDLEELLRALTKRMKSKMKSREETSRGVPCYQNVSSSTVDPPPDKLIAGLTTMFAVRYKPLPSVSDMEPTRIFKKYAEGFPEEG